MRWTAAQRQPKRKEGGDAHLCAPPGRRCFQSLTMAAAVFFIVVREDAKSVELDKRPRKGGEPGARRVCAPPWRCSARCHFPSCRCVWLPARCACLSLGVASPGACGVSSHNLAGTQPFLLAAPGRRGTWTRAAQGREDKHGAASARDRSPPPARCIPHCATRGSGGRV